MEKNNFFKHKTEFRYTQKTIKKKKNYTIYELTFPSPVKTPFPENNIVCSRYYKANNSKRAVVIVHGLEGELLAKYFSAYLSNKGISCFQITMPYSRKRVPRKRRKHFSNKEIDFSEVFPIGFNQAVLDIRLATDFLKERYVKIGILGTSLGALIASLTAEVDGRFGAAVYFLGGCDPANILWDSKNFFLKFYKNILKNNISLEDLQEKWKVINPINYISGNVQNILMINAKYDQTIPPKYSQELWESLGRPEIRWLKATHFTASFYIPYIKKEIEKFFNKTLI